jgi:uncharacterized protein
MRRLVFLCLMAAGSAAAQTPPNLPYLAVQGRATETLVPDVFPVAITLSETSIDSAGAQARIEALARDVLSAAKKVGVEDGDIVVGNLRVSPNMEWDEKSEQQVFTGNLYQREFVLRLRKLESLRSLAAALPASRSLRVQTQPFERSDADAIRNRLRDTAIANARKQANALAASAGVRLGRLHNVSDRPQGWNYNSLPMGRSLDSFTVSGTASNQLTSAMVVSQGKITLEADAYLVYLIAE